MYKVLLRPLAIEDASKSFHWRNDPEVWRFTGSRPDRIITEEAEKTWLSEKLAENNSTRFAITVDDRYVGNVQITDIIGTNTGQYHIFIGEKEFWGKGIARLATLQIIRYAKVKLRLKELFLLVHPEHESAIRLYKSCGFINTSDEMRMILNLNSTLPPLVSVFVITYNHEEFIGQALDGILSQKTNFDFEIVLGEDCSKDQTRKRILEYSEKYPGKFKLLLHEKNVGAMVNQISTLRACDGEYIAICEGDDYWTYPYKLQEQVGFLESNKKYAMCFTRYNVVNSSGKVLQENNGYSKDLSHEDIFSKKCPPTATSLFRTESLDYSLNSEIWNELTYGDHALFGFITKKGMAKSLNKNCVNYRIHRGGVWSQDGFDNRLIKSQMNFEVMKKYFKEPCELYAIDKGILKIKKKLLHYYLYHRRGKDFFRLSFQFIGQYKLMGFFYLLLSYLYLIRKMFNKALKVIKGFVFRRRDDDLDQF